jgi:phosphoribosylformylglycinamidine cyclo-ligase
MTHSQSHYQAAGVNIDAGQQAVDLMKSAIRATYTSAVLSDTGNFGGLFEISHLKSMNAPVLVASTDGVGTKTKVATRLQRWDSIGQDLVNHCVNDIL